MRKIKVGLVQMSFVADKALNLQKYIDGVLVGQQALEEGVDGRWSTGPTALLFADNNGDNAQGLCNSVQFHPRVLSDAELALIGRPTASGIPIQVPHPLTIISITPGLFDFELRWAGGVPPFQVERRDAFGSGVWVNAGFPTDSRTAIVDRIGDTGFVRVLGQ